MAPSPDGTGPSSLDAAPASPRPLPPTQGKGNRKPYNGCLNCKDRKIKCDKTRPFCLRCLRSARECGGYPVPSPSAPNRFRVNSLPEFDSQEEARVFDFYLKRSSPALSGDMDLELWSKLVVQLSMAEPAVRHAALAVSSLHRHSNLTYRQGRQRRRSLGADEKFALSQYGKAIKALRLWTPPDTGEHDKVIVPLVVCLLFVAVEFLRGDQTCSQVHICQGRKLLAELGAQNLSPRVSSFLKTYVVPVYQRLGLACYLFGTVPSLIPSQLRPCAADGTIGILASIEQARNELYDVLDEILLFVNMTQCTAYSKASHEGGDISDDVVDEKTRFEEKQKHLLWRLELWNVAFTALTVTLPSMALPMTTNHLLKMYYHGAKMWVLAALVPSEVAFDQYLESFSAMITSGVVIIDSLRGRRQANHTEHAFSFETEVIGPLYWMCIKCRHPVLRRAALKLLQREEMKTRRENLWSAEAIAAVSKFVIAAEESERRSTHPSSEDGIPASSASPLPQGDESVLADPILRVPASSPPTIRCYTHRELLDILSESQQQSTDPMPAPSLPAQDATIPGAAVRSTLSTVYIASRSASPPSPPSKASAPVSETAATSQLPPDLERTDAQASAATAQLLTPPFGIPDMARVKNVILGPWEDEGTWVTIFRDPLVGKTEWDVKRTFIRI